MRDRSRKPEIKSHKTRIPTAIGFLCVLCVLRGSISSRAAEPEVSDKEMPRFPAVEPKDALSTVRVRPGFHMELAAHEPNVVSPVAMAFDDNNRLYVVAMIIYSE